MAETQRASIPERRRFLGHPIGLAYLAFTEAWERFSFYGMSALLLLYMIQYLLTPGVVSGVYGLSMLRGAIEGVTGPLSDQAFASQVFGLYTGFVYFTPIAGGVVADRWLGRKATVVLGALMMAAGHLLMAFDRSFLLALLLLILGTGCLKGNISAQVGQLYAATDEAGRTRAFAVFSAAINFGALIGPLACGVIAQAYGWHAGFGLASVLMLIALATYVAGWKHLPSEPERVVTREAHAPLTGRDRKLIAALILLTLLTSFPIAGLYQQFNAGLLFIEASVDRNLFGWTIPAPSFMSLDGLFCILAVTPLIRFWKWQNDRGHEPGDLGKIAIGYGITALAAAVMVVPATIADRGQSVSAIWALMMFAINAVGFLFYWPTQLGLFSRIAPPQVNSTMMGVLFLALFFGNLLAGALAGQWQHMPHADFYTLHAALAFAPAVVMLLVQRRLARPGAVPAGA